MILFKCNVSALLSIRLKGWALLLTKPVKFFFRKRGLNLDPEDPFWFFFYPFQMSAPGRMLPFGFQIGSPLFPPSSS